VNVGIVGGGQLGRMLALAGYPLGACFRILDPMADACAGQVAPLIHGNYNDAIQLEWLANWAEVVTFDFENVPAAAAQAFAGRVAFHPPSEALAIAQARRRQKPRSVCLQKPCFGNSVFRPQTSLPSIAWKSYNAQ